jgi:hypothetical protein
MELLVNTIASLFICILLAEQMTMFSLLLHSNRKAHRKSIDETYGSLKIPNSLR